MTVFVDSSIWYASVDDGESRSVRARELLLRDEHWLTTDHCLVETWLLVNARIGRYAAEGFWQGVREGPVEVEHVSPVDLERAWAIGEDFPDQDFSLVDRTSFTVMRRLGLDRVASFDNDFAVFRYGPKRDRAFTVLS